MITTNNDICFDKLININDFNSFIELDTIHISTFIQSAHGKGLNVFIYSGILSDFLYKNNISFSILNWQWDSINNRWDYL